MPLILEGLVTTTNLNDSINIAPMGPIVDREVTHLTLRPFQSSQTYLNLKRLGSGVFHITDDVELLVRAALNQIDTAPRTIAVSSVSGAILTDACRWFAFRVRELDDREQRTRIECDVVESGRLRDFFGFNRAKHAVLEGAILATRIGIIAADQIREDFQRLEIIVEKTAGDEERRAWQILTDYIQRQLPPQSG
jgi:hypothetical protein